VNGSILSASIRYAYQMTGPGGGVRFKRATLDLQIPLGNEVRTLVPKPGTAHLMALGLIGLIGFAARLAHGDTRSGSRHGGTRVCVATASPFALSRSRGHCQ
jgi:hypothetical protein